MSKRKDNYPIRTINLKLIPNIEQEQGLDDYIDNFSSHHDEAMNRFLFSGRTEAFPKGTKGVTGCFLNPAEKAMLWKDLGQTGSSGTFIDLAAGSSASADFKARLKKVRKELKAKDNEIRKLETENPALLKPTSVWFQEIGMSKRVTSKCVMCGEKGKHLYKSDETEESICDVCALDFFRFHKEIKTLRRHAVTDYYLCKKICEEENVSKSLKKIIERFQAPLEKLSGTSTDKAMYKKGAVKIDFDTKTATLQLRKKLDGGIPKIEVKFLGEGYYLDYPHYGYQSDQNKFKNLILDFLKNGGYPNIFRRIVMGKKEYFLSIPTHYPVSEVQKPVKGCILVSNRSILVYTKDAAPAFIKLYKPYMRKRIKHAKGDKVKDHNKNLYLFNWESVPQKESLPIEKLK